MPDVIYPALHGRQHCPGGEDPIPCWPSDRPWARLGLGGNTAPNNTWTKAECSDAMSYNEPTPGDIFTLDSSLGYYRIICEANGLYLVNGIVTWTNSFTEYRAVDMQAGLGDHLYFEGFGLTAHHGPVSSVGGDYFDVDVVNGFIFKSESVSAPDPTLDPRALQQSGSDRTFDLQSLRVIYLGPMGAEADWVFNP